MLYARIDPLSLGAQRLHSYSFFLLLFFSWNSIEKGDGANEPVLLRVREKEQCEIRFVHANVAAERERERGRVEGREGAREEQRERENERRRDAKERRWNFIGRRSMHFSNAKDTSLWYAPPSLWNLRLLHISSLNYETRVSRFRHTYVYVYIYMHTCIYIHMYIVLWQSLCHPMDFSTGIVYLKYRFRELFSHDFARKRFLIGKYVRI